MVCAPAVESAASSAASPCTSVTRPSSVVPSLNVTVPVGVLPAAPVTVASSRTSPSTGAGFWLEVRATWVAVFVITLPTVR